MMRTSGSMPASQVAPAPLTAPAPNLAALDLAGPAPGSAGKEAALLRMRSLLPHGPAPSVAARLGAAPCLGARAASRRKHRLNRPWASLARDRCHSEPVGGMGRVLSLVGSFHRQGERGLPQRGFALANLLRRPHILGIGGPCRARREPETLPAPTQSARPQRD